MHEIMAKDSNCETTKTLSFFQQSTAASCLLSSRIVIHRHTMLYPTARHARSEASAVNQHRAPALIESARRQPEKPPCMNNGA